MALIPISSTVCGHERQIVQGLAKVGCLECHDPVILRKTTSWVLERSNIDGPGAPAGLTVRN
jgi:hypothetical protein